MYCMKCGANLPDNAEFCPFCGTKSKYKPMPHAATPDAPESAHQATNREILEARSTTPQNTTPMFSGTTPQNSTPNFSSSTPQNAAPNFNSSTPPNVTPGFNRPSANKTTSTSWLPILAAVMAFLALFIGLGTFFLIKNKQDTTGSAGFTQNSGSNNQTASKAQTANAKKKNSTAAKKNNNTKKFFLSEVWEYEYGTNVYAKSIKTYEYDDNWNLITEKKDNKPVYEYEYDANGNRISKSEYNKYGAYMGKQVYEYDETGTYIIREIFTNSENEVYAYGECEYDEQNRITSYTLDYLGGSMSEYHEYSYNSDGTYYRVEHIYINGYETQIIRYFNADRCEYRREEEGDNYKYVYEYERSDDQTIISRIETRYIDDVMVFQISEIGDLDDQGYVYHSNITTKEFIKADNAYVESHYDSYQENDKYGNKLHYWNEESGEEYYYVYVDKAGNRYGNDFEHRGVTE